MMGNRLREILNREKVSAYRLWRDLGIDQGQLSRFFQGKQNISLEKLAQIADYLGYEIAFVKRGRSRKGGRTEWDVSTGEEKSIGSSTTAKASPTRNPPRATSSRLQRGS